MRPTVQAFKVVKAARVVVRHPFAVSTWFSYFRSSERYCEIDEHWVRVSILLIRECWNKRWGVMKRDDRTGDAINSQDFVASIVLYKSHSNGISRFILYVRLGFVISNLSRLVE